MFSPLRAIGQKLAVATSVAGASVALAGSVEDEIAALKQALEAQQAVIQQLRGQVAQLEGKLGESASRPVAVTPPQQIDIQQSAGEPLPPVQDELSFRHHDWGFEVYGYVKVDAAYDTQCTYNGDFARYVLPEACCDDNQLSITARQTRLGFNVNGPVWDGWRPAAKIETDFYGNASGSTPELRLRLAYAQMEREGWLIRAGQDWDALTVALPRTVNFATYANQGALWSRRALIKAQWTQADDHGKLQITGAVAQAVSADIDGGGQLDGQDSGVPNLEGAIAYTWNIDADWTLLTAVSGAWGQEAFDQPLGGERVFDGYAGMFTASLDWRDQAKLLGAAWYGANLGSFNGGIGQTVNLFKGEAIRARGGWVQLQTFPWEDFNWNLAVGIDDPLNDDLNPGMRNFNLNASTSVYYQVTSYLTLMAEYSFMQTGYQGLPTADNNRFQTAAMVEF